MSLVHYANIQQYGTDLVSREIRGNDMAYMLKDESEEREEEEGFNYKSKQRKVVSEQVTLEETYKKSRNSGTIFYTKPYNYLVSKDRRQIMNFLFWIGINSRRNF